MQCSDGPTYHTAPNTSGGRPGCLPSDEEEGHVVIRNFGPDVPLGRGSCDSAINHSKVARSGVGTPGPHLEIRRVGLIIYVEATEDIYRERCG